MMLKELGNERCHSLVDDIYSVAKKEVIRDLLIIAFIFFISLLFSICSWYVLFNEKRCPEIFERLISVSLFEKLYIIYQDVAKHVILDMSVDRIITLVLGCSSFVAQFFSFSKQTPKESNFKFNAIIHNLTKKKQSCIERLKTAVIALAMLVYMSDIVCLFISIILKLWLATFLAIFSYIFLLIYKHRAINILRI